MPADASTCRLDRRNTIAESGPYSHGLASCSATSLPRKRYHTSRDMSDMTCSWTIRARQLDLHFGRGRRLQLDCIKFDVGPAIPYTSRRQRHVCAKGGGRDVSICLSAQLRKELIVLGML